jgi:hypothetical protein
MADYDAFCNDLGENILFRNNALILYALQLYFSDIDDINSVAHESITDGPNDKGVDLIYIDQGREVAVIAQGYFSTGNKPVGDYAKAEKLSASIGWILGNSDDDLLGLPAKLKSVIDLLRSLLKSRKISQIEIWYVHNRQESKNIQREIDTAAKTANHIVKSHYDGTNCSIRGLEVGTTTIEEWFSSSSGKISLTNDFELEVADGYEVKSEDWRAYVTTIPASWLYEVYHTHKESLFALNLRQYLGAKKARANINNKTIQTAKNEPDNFWVFNNGVTALVNGYQYDRAAQKLKIRGISIVNGAQTTGAIGELTQPLNGNLRVAIRFIVCQKQEIVDNIIRYNNTQNKVEPSDFRSMDDVQDRLRKEFKNYGKKLDYTGGRRGGYASASTRRRGSNEGYIPASTVAQALMAFHSKLSIAINSKSEIWESDTHYSTIFNQHTTVKHMLFVFSLYRSIIAFKENLENIQQPTEDDQKAIDIVGSQGAVYVIIALVSHKTMIEVILDTQIPDKFKLSFSGKPSVQDAVSYWQELIEIFLNISLEHLFEMIKNRKFNQDDLDKVCGIVRGHIKSDRKRNPNFYARFKEKISFND